MRMVHAFLRARSFLGLERASDALIAEQYRLLAKQIPICYSILILNSIIMAALVSHQAPAVLSFSFPVVFIPAMICRMMVWRKRSLDLFTRNDVSRMRRSLGRTVIAANFMAVAMAIWAVFLMRELPHAEIAAVPLFIILSMITCAYCLAANPLSAYSVAGTGGLYIALAMAHTGDPAMMAMAANIVLVSGMVIYMVAHQNQQIRRVVGSHARAEEQRREAHLLAHVDQLTGLANRRALMSVIAQAQKDNPQALSAVIMIDLNRFKSVNDTFGHAVGDLLLAEVGKRIEEVMAGQGLISRLGGDEFCVFLSSLAAEAAIRDAAEQIRQAIKKPILIDDHSLRLGAAIGIAMGTGKSQAGTELIRQADIALFDSKARGGASISFFSEDMWDRVTRRTIIEQALANHDSMAEIDVHFQPIFEMRSGRQIGYEALARWQHGLLGAVSPMEFIEAAEHNGMARRLTLHLFRKALAVARDWDDDQRLSFNLSGSGFCTAEFENSLPELLNEAGFPASRLTLEVTETSLLQDTAASWAVLEQLQKLGAKIVLDDFGAGHASVGYLRDLQLDGIKLDGSLIKDITHDMRSRRLLFGILQLCRSIGTSVTAEMVETNEQLAALHAFPIDFVQGYLLGRPCSAIDTLRKNPLAGTIPCAFPPTAGGLDEKMAMIG